MQDAEDVLIETKSRRWVITDNDTIPSPSSAFVSSCYGDREIPGFGYRIGSRHTQVRFLPSSPSMRR